ncbi:MAG TPA: hypothetical protein VL572_02125 [Pyrinomonadaceae bacterium]|nr:hypothetical protein [Pyrinomonadaceae bacterium]
MFCSSCGKTINPDLRYCNHCGARLDADGDGSMRIPESSFNLLVGGLLAVPIAGIGLIIGLLTVMKRELGFGDEMIAIMALLCTALLLLTELGLLWLLWTSARHGRVRKAKPGQQNLPEHDVELRGLPESRIEPADRQVQSVTEHTTRTLDAVPRK